MLLYWCCVRVTASGWVIACAGALRTDAGTPAALTRSGPAAAIKHDYCPRLLIMFLLLCVDHHDKNKDNAELHA